MKPAISRIVLSSKPDIDVIGLIDNIAVQYIILLLLNYAQ